VVLPTVLVLTGFDSTPAARCAGVQ
jgi:hypothetical protein